MDDEFQCIVDKYHVEKTLDESPYHNSPDFYFDSDAIFYLDPTCPTGWNKFNNVCYVIGRFGNYNGARAACSGMPEAQLVMITSQNEQDFLAGMFK